MSKLGRVTQEELSREGIGVGLDKIAYYITLFKRVLGNYDKLHFF